MPGRAPQSTADDAVPKSVQTPGKIEVNDGTPPGQNKPTGMSSMERRYKGAEVSTELRQTFGLNKLGEKERPKTPNVYLAEGDIGLDISRKIFGEPQIQQRNSQYTNDDFFARATERALSASTPSKANIKSQQIERKIDPQENILSGYVSYTYNFDLYLLDRSAFNSMVLNPDETRAFTKHLLISSGDKRSGRSPIFEDSFYIDDFEMKTVSAATGISKNTNMTNFKFKITEPYGITFLERIETLLRTDFRGINPKQYSQLPFLMKISFTGYNDDGIPTTVPNSVRYIPMKLTNITFDVNEGGANYVVTGVPYNQEAFSSVTQSLPKNIEIDGATVGNFLSDGITVIDQVLEERQVTRRSNPTDTFGRPGQTINENKTVPVERRLKAATLETLLNDFYESQITGGAGATSKGTQSGKRESKGYRNFPDKVKFEFYDEFRSATIDYDNVPLDNIPNDKAFENNAFLKNFVSSIDPSRLKLDVKNRTLRINQNTSIVKVIEILMLHSSYITDQLDLENTATVRDDKPLKWFKITPRILLGPWDSKIGRFSYEVTYFVSPYTIFNVNFKRAPRGGPHGRGYHKTYDYIYTGQNSELLNFDIKYNIAYLRQATLASGDERLEEPEGNDSADFNTQTSFSSNATAVSGVGLPDEGTRGAAGAAYDLSKEVLLEGPEMIGLKAEIIGDPAYIMQSDIFQQRHLVPSIDQSMTPFLPDGTINYDYGDILVNIRFRFPSDYSDTGLMDLGSNNKFRQSEQFSGVYKVTHVDHTFSGGQFVQNLRGIRLLKTTDPRPSAPSEERTAGSLLDTVASNAARLYEGRNRQRPAISGAVEYAILDEARLRQQRIDELTPEDETIRRTHQDFDADVAQSIPEEIRRRNNITFVSEDEG